jgi:NADPH-dependent ferric siderophore reductase
MADRLLDLVGQQGGPLADASLWHLKVTHSEAFTPNLHRLVLTAPGLDELKYQAGQDLMLRVPLSGGHTINRRYTIRRFDPSVPAVTIDVSLHGTGPGTDWIRSATAGDHIDAIGPRGKVTVRNETDWHLFIGDETGLPGVLAMIESLPPGSAAIALLEVDGPADEQQPTIDQAPGIDLRWLHRLERSAPGDDVLFIEALSACDLPAGRGHAYISAESRVVRAIQRVLGEMGLDPEQISGKAYWRRGLPNAEHGEPTKEG